MGRTSPADRNLKMNLAEILDVYLGSDGQATATMYKKLNPKAP